MSGINFIISGSGAAARAAGGFAAADCQSITRITTGDRPLLLKGQLSRNEKRCWQLETGRHQMLHLRLTSLDNGVSLALRASRDSRKSSATGGGAARSSTLSFCQASAGRKTDLYTSVGADAETLLMLTTDAASASYELRISLD